ncbi:MAG TPA: carboxypeptidase-like regulatory domain-containing protein [Anaerolineae bacterium]|nr:carboxypeptidase-like regulatory domain-containing protein [Anaerolineae bacterium]
MTKIQSRFGLMLAGVALAFITASLTVQATSGILIIPPTLSGVITLPGGSLPVPVGTKAMLLNLDRSIKGTSVVSITTGAYTFPVIEPGVYLIRGEPPIGSLTYGPSDLIAVHVLTQAVTVPTLTLSTPSVSGTVYLPDGFTPANSSVEVFTSPHGIPVLVEVRSALSGTFVIGGLPTGTYTLKAIPFPNLPYWKSVPIDVLIDPGAPQYISLTLRPASVYGLVKDALNFPVQNAVVHAVDANGHHRYDVSGSLGVFAQDKQMNNAPDRVTRSGVCASVFSRATSIHSWANSVARSLISFWLRVMGRSQM